MLRRASLAARTGARAMCSSAGEFRRVGVLGMGSMGHGIAQLAAMGKYDVVAVDSNEGALHHAMGAVEGSLRKLAEKRAQKGELSADEVDADVAATRGRITTGTTLDALAECDLVVEAIVENIDVKKTVFADLCRVTDASAVLASNTSSLSITDIASATNRPDRVIGLHFFNPVQLMPLVEVVQTSETDERVMRSADLFARGLGKEPITCSDTPGFVVNRLLIPYLSSALFMLERGVATADDIDKGMRLGAGHPMGPITLADYVGLDVVMFVLEGWQQRFPGDPAFSVPAILRQKVEAGTLGRKTGSGFFEWKGNKRA